MRDRDMISQKRMRSGVRTLVRDRTDSRWLPSKGDRLSLSYEQVSGDFDFGRAVVDYRIYHTLYLDPLDRKHILAARATAGAIFGEAPVFERFYGGGLGFIRGFDFRGISPRQGPADHPVGGDFMTLLGAEYTFPLAGRELRGVLFVDTGAVEREAGIWDYRVSAGFGIRIHAPFFGRIPMTLDFAFPINKHPDDDTELVSFSIPAAEFTTAGPLPLTLYWQGLGGTSPLDYIVFTHLLAEDGHLIGQHDGPPAGGNRPVTQWTAGEVIEDLHSMAFQDTSYAGPARIAVGLYDPAGGRILNHAGSDQVICENSTFLEANSAGPG